MTSTTDDPWVGLSPDATHWVGKRHSGTHGLSLYWAVHPNGAVGLVVAGMVTSAIPDELPKPKGITLDIVEQGEAASLRMFLQHPQDRDIFHRLCQDVIHYTSGISDKAAATAGIFLRLRRWQSMLGVATGRELSEREVRGLIAELWVMRDLLEPRIGFWNAFQSWVAPNGHPQDFAGSSGLLETKARLAGSRQQVRISSLEQLDLTQLPLHLLVVELTPSENASIFLSLNEMTDVIVSKGAALGPAHERTVCDTIARTGYVPSPSYDRLRYAASGTHAYRVDGTFPALRRSVTDARITAATYTLSVAALGEFEVPMADVLNSYFANH
jgi:hypothetical protein